MKKLLGCFLCVMLLVFGVAASVQATTIVYGTGWGDIPFVATAGSGPGGDLPSNYDVTLLDEMIDGWNLLYNPDLPDIAPTPIKGLDISGYFIDTSSSGDDTSGTISGLAGYDYLSVKYDGYVDLMYIAGRSSYDWSTDGVYGFSHARVYNPTSIPDASVMLLLGSSFLVLAVFSKKRKTS
ncbi:MAG: hypothetical protein LWX54_12635 [Deltaproteobacteria bacterium]|jgi:hypothetical protein|nr:hypothetical protein [Deltaproteobacteria bacterium]